MDNFEFLMGVSHEYSTSHEPTGVSKKWNLWIERCKNQTTIETTKLELK